MSEATVEPVLNWPSTERARRRNQAKVRLLQSSSAVTVELLAKGRASTVAAARQWLHRERSKGQVITVAHGRQVLIPTFQLDEDFSLRSASARLVARLVDSGMEPWAIWDWMEHPNPWLNGVPPAELLGDDPAAVDRAVSGLLQD